MSEVLDLTTNDEVLDISQYGGDGSATWGQIGGDITQQADLQAALANVNTTAGSGLTKNAGVISLGGTLTEKTDLIANSSSIIFDIKIGTTGFQFSNNGLTTNAQIEAAAGINMGANSKIINLGDGTDPNDAVNLSQLAINRTSGTTSLQLDGEELIWPNDLQNGKIRLWNTDATSDVQYYGFGIQNGALIYQVDSSTSKHVFQGANQTTDTAETILEMDHTSGIVAHTDLHMGDNSIANVKAGVNARDAVNKEQLDALILQGTGVPNGTVAAPVGTIYVDTAVTNGASSWIKKSGAGNTGWVVLEGDTEWRDISSLIDDTIFDNTARFYAQVRRTDNLVEMLVDITPLNASGAGEVDIFTNLAPLAGFRPNSGVWERIALVNTGGTAMIGYSKPGHDYKLLWTAGGPIRARYVYSTSQAWPTTLPGTPA